MNITMDQLKSVIKECIQEMNDSVNEASVDIISLKNGEFNFKGIRKSATKLDLVKDISSKFSKFSPVGKYDKAVTSEDKMDTFTKPGKLQFGKPLTESKEYILEFFGTKKKENTVKVGKYILQIIGTTTSGYPVAVCDKIKIRDTYVTLFGNAKFSIFSDTVVSNIALLASIVNSNYMSMLSQGCTLFREKDESCTLTVNDIKSIDMIQGSMSNDEKGNQYIDIFLSFVTSNADMPKVGLLVYASLSDSQIYISPCKY